ncbi:copper chaperone PCu(A)C [Streptomyces sp. NPDC047072]|uniref:copper chaperone PCu(A)C n=1 Tax=Streptomyces sp. NPDC047072 TaxID=3154809 RepID=UPI0033E281AA
MSSSLRRGALAASAIAFSVAALSACAAGNNAQTLEVKPDNAATTVGTIKLQNVVVITQPNDEDGQTKGPAAVSATVFNTGDEPQTLDSISVDGGGSAEIKAAKGKGAVSVPAHGSIVLGGKGNASAALSELGEGIKDGNAQKITFTFSETGDVSLRAFVVPADSYYEKWGPSAVPSTPAATGKPSATPTGSATPSGAATPTDAASASATAESH